MVVAIAAGKDGNLRNEVPEKEFIGIKERKCQGDKGKE
jgi:hypothetical protein